MIKYIYYRICKDWERKQELGKTLWESPPGWWSCSAFFFLFFPFTFLGFTLMYNDNILIPFLGALPFSILSYYLSERFEKRMQTYQPPERYKKYDDTPLYYFTGPLVMIMYFWALGVIFLLLFCVIEPFHLKGWLYNLLFM